MLCPKCGKEVEEGDKFCSSCGTPIEHIRETEVIPEKVPYWVGLALCYGFIILMLVLWITVEAVWCIMYDTWGSLREPLVWLDGLPHVVVPLIICTIIIIKAFKKVRIRLVEE